MYKIKLVVFPDYGLEYKFANTPDTIVRIYTLLQMAGYQDVSILDCRNCRNDSEFQQVILCECLHTADIYLLSAVSCQGNLVSTTSYFLKQSVPKCKIAVGGNHITSICKSNKWDTEDLSRLHPDIDIFVNGYIWNKEDVKVLVEGITSIHDSKHIVFEQLHPYKEEIVVPMMYEGLGANDVCKGGGWIRKTGTGDIRTQNMMMSMGCAFHCTFCFNPYKRTVNAEPKVIIDELVRRMETYNIDGIKFDDDDPVQNLNWNDKFLDAMEEVNLPLQYLISTRCDIHRGDYKKLKQLVRFSKVGLKIVGLGVEFPSDTVLTNVRKGLRVSYIKDAIDKLNRYTDCEILSYSIFGLPPVNRKVIDEAIDFIQWAKGKLKHLSMTSFTPLIASPIYEEENCNRVPIGADGENPNWDTFYFTGDFDKIRYLPEGLSEDTYMEYKLEVYKCLKENGFLRKETANDIKKAGYSI